MPAYIIAFLLAHVMYLLKLKSIKIDWHSTMYFRIVHIVRLVEWRVVFLLFCQVFQISWKWSLVPALKRCTFRDSEIRKARLIWARKPYGPAWAKPCRWKRLETCAWAKDRLNGPEPVSLLVFNRCDTMGFHIFSVVKMPLGWTQAIGICFRFLAIGWLAGGSGGADDPEVATSCADRLARKACNALHWSKHLAAHCEGLDCEQVSSRHVLWAAELKPQAYPNWLFSLRFPSKHSCRFIIPLFCQCH